MASDREMLRVVWEGKLPVCFQLHQSDADIQIPEPLYLMVPRLSYFPLVTDKVRKHFKKYIPPEKQDAEMWLDYDGNPLQWHYPIGVLFDIFESDIQLPWVINVRFDDFPEETLLHCPSKEYVESHFLSSLKEADVMKHKTQIVTNMQKKDHHQLWLGLQNDKFDQFWAVNRKLMESGPDECFKNIPFKLYIREEHYIQKLVKPCLPAGERKTFGDFINEVVPTSVDMSSFKILLHGIEMPHETPLQWMSEHLSYPDNFLHFVISSKSSGNECGSLPLVLH